MVRINGLFHLLINKVYWSYIPLILTFDPNFQQDIQVLNEIKYHSIHVAIGNIYLYLLLNVTIFYLM